MLISIIFTAMVQAQIPNYNIHNTQIFDKLINKSISPTQLNEELLNYKNRGELTKNNIDNILNLIQVNDQGKVGNIETPKYLALISAIQWVDYQETKKQKGYSLYPGVITNENAIDFLINYGLTNQNLTIVETSVDYLYLKVPREQLKKRRSNIYKVSLLEVTPNAKLLFARLSWKEKSQEINKYLGHSKQNTSEADHINNLILLAAYGNSSAESELILKYRQSDTSKRKSIFIRALGIVGSNKAIEVLKNGLYLEDGELGPTSTEYLSALCYQYLHYNNMGAIWPIIGEKPNLEQIKYVNQELANRVQRQGE